MGDAGPVLVVLTGPSGAGKDSLLERLKPLVRSSHFPANATDRPPRSGERDGVDYYFVSTRRFEEMLRDGELLEHARVYDQWKGVPKAPIREAFARGENVILRTDVQGARYIKSVIPEAVTIFVAPPSSAELERRLHERGGDSDEQVALRLQTAREEMAATAEFDHVVVNDDLASAAAEVAGIIERERTRPGRKAPAL